MRKTEVSGAINVREVQLSNWTELEAKKHLAKIYRIHFSRSKTKARDRAENPFTGDIGELALCVLELLCKHSSPKSHEVRLATRVGMPRWADTKACIVGVKVLAQEPDLNLDAMFVDGLELARKLHTILPFWAFGILTKNGREYSFGPVLVPGEDARRPVPIPSERFSELQIARAVA